MTSDFDVIISGAGPAGCTAALALGSSGLRIALIEKERFPRDKVCGDAIPAYVPKVLNTINPEYAVCFKQIAEKTESDSCRVYAPNRKSLDMKFPEHGFLCKRLIFDNFLFELASHLPNVTVFQETAVRDITINQNHALVSAGNGFALTAQLAIGCDGPGSIVRKRLDPERSTDGEGSVAARAYFRNVKDIPPGTLEFHFLKDYLPGYFWIFPLPDNQFNVGLGMPSRLVSGKKINPRRELMRIIKTDPFLSPRFSETEMIGDISGHFLPLLTRKKALSGERFMLCGDAASLINPATGGGIGQAMQSGRYAGWQALKCFEKNDFSSGFMKDYDNLLYEKIWKENRKYLMLRNFIIKFGFNLNILIRAGSISTSLKKVVLNRLTLTP